MKTKKNKKVRHHLKIKPFITLVFIILFIALLVFYFANLKIKSIYINGTTYLSDNDIIEAAKIKNYPKLFKYSTFTMKNNIEKLSLVDSARVSKTLFGKVKITVSEATPILYNRNKSTYVLTNGEETNEYNFTGVPFLINYVPDNIYERLVKELKDIDKEALSMVSEIEYSPSMSGDVTIDDTRFLFRMNDGNQVYINLINIDRLNSYPLIYTILEEKGVLELDSDNESVVFKSFKSITENQS
jgi:cell division septal protein FtsQ